MKNIFTEHPNSIGESYFTHLKFACYFAAHMLIAGSACLTHGIFPFVFKSTGSDIVIKMMHKIVERKPEVRDELVGIFPE